MKSEMNLASDVGFQSRLRAGSPSRTEPPATGSGRAGSLTGMEPGPVLSSVPGEWTSFIQDRPQGSPEPRPRARQPQQACDSPSVQNSERRLGPDRKSKACRRGIEEISRPPSGGGGTAHPQKPTHLPRPILQDPPSFLFRIPPAPGVSPTALLSTTCGWGVPAFLQSDLPKYKPARQPHAAQPSCDSRRPRMNAHSLDPPRHLALGLL